MLLKHVISGGFHVCCYRITVVVSQGWNCIFYTTSSCSLFIDLACNSNAMWALSAYLVLS